MGNFLNISFIINKSSNKGCIDIIADTEDSLYKKNRRRNNKNQTSY